MNFIRISLRIAAPLVLFAASLLPAHAQNIVQDDDFEQAPPVTATYGSNASHDGGPAFDSYWTIQNNIQIDTKNKYVFAGGNSRQLPCGASVRRFRADHDENSSRAVRVINSSTATAGERPSWRTALMAASTGV